MSRHDDELARAFDGQAAKFEVAPVQSDPEALARLVAFAALPADSLVLDAGCGPGLVSATFLKAGHRVGGVDLSAEMVARARARCESFADRAWFEQGSIFDARLNEDYPFDAAVSRYVLHHVVEPFAFVARQVELLRPGGVLVLSDHSTDPDPARAAHHERLERERDRTHTRNLTAGGLADLLASAGLVDIRLQEESFHLDFDEWFDRGTPAAPKESVRAALLEGPPLRGFRPTLHDDGSIRIDCVRPSSAGSNRSEQQQGWLAVEVSEPPAVGTQRAGGSPACPPATRSTFSGGVQSSRPSSTQAISSRSGPLPVSTSTVSGVTSSRSWVSMNFGKGAHAGFEQVQLPAERGPHHQAALLPHGEG
ncbi:MAG: class I SAM-dependent methyltransferase [Isosphaeraceae bacterium]